ncbi:PAS domain-containing sensor histidine kinase [Sulfitobacter sp. M57]|uniref:sensor histidine kinase NtrY-like n=1 Tax=unclassified Sulfitobacter TaxID=196795 RepID=UPI0023E23E04|nr:MULTISPECIES: PAS domain-containing sensor histidine kinase [unclassified Sulfitobacter]MDF3413694.1 PAS domain-containing sensor histidine kinase [Sulfitobacter sp. KE5]MDF3421025.1 PAS domain-containing sensor histidine kinase [Sulfitobacter sp. KE43]MDF3432240.1 PAS domain-containing sensor histidine kinase [Sulfitobacter sp. KE42]MDF3457879.1 PAS domain-containing sensor histidine kinase [Sulfitobacter sp. S74]MDF3461780.1 PAS domain-containing sensor histidine kinase [Sulfitobacter sp.
MATRSHKFNLDRLGRLRRIKRVRNLSTLGLVVLGPVLALATYLVMGPLGQGANTLSLRLVLLTDLVYVLLIAALVLSQVARLIAARRAKSAGSRLHLRLTGVFALMALIPTVTVAVFAGLTVNVGLEGWFSDRVRGVVGSSLAAAQAYEAEQRQDLIADARALARTIDNARNQGVGLSDSQILGESQRQIQRGLREAYLIDGTAEIRARGDRSYLFDFEKPDADQLANASNEGLLVIEDWPNNEFRALVPMKSFVDRYLYVSRDVDGKILSLLDETTETVRLYQQLEADRGRLLFEFGLLYLGFAVILILAAVWLGLWFAERLSGPVGRLTGAAQQVGAGNLNVQVREEDGDDEIAMLSRYFNQMTKQLQGQRETLLDNTRQIERRRRLFDSVLSSVTSGVVGLDPEGRVTFVNRSAMRLLDWSEDQQSVALSVAVPEFGPLFETISNKSGDAAQDEIKVSRQGAMENLLVRMSTRRTDDGRLEGYVVAFDDVTDLVSAQRMAAWGDVARRIAHEIKNPLTPIQLSAERIKRKFAPKLGIDSDSLEQMTGVIIRQTGDLRRIVDEFSKFARMPEPETSSHDLTRLVRDAVFLQQSGQPDVAIKADLGGGVILADIDATMISQALTNLIKNAGEAIETLQKNNPPDELIPQIFVTLRRNDTSAKLTIADNGIGLPEDRARLFEPYVTTRSEGTGLGLPIVKKIIEEHGGTLTLDNAPVFDGQTHFGAMAVITLPVAPLPKEENNASEKAQRVEIVDE